MPAHVTGYVYVMAMAAVMFLLLQKPMTASLMSPQDFARRRNAWIGITTASFLAHSYWVFIFAAAIIAWLAAQRDSNRPALYAMLLLTVSNFEADVPGFGIVNFLFRMSPARLLCLVILVPLAFRLMQERHPTSGLQKLNLSFVLAFVALTMIVLSFARVTTLANIFRNLVDVMLLTVVPFYVMMHLRDLRQMREVLASVVMGFSLLGLFALFETVRHWLVFEAIREPLGLPPPAITLYVIRETDGGGALRAMTTAGHPIVLGYFMGAAVCLWVGLRKALQPSMLGLVALGALLIGLLAALSRGPWVGAAVGLLALVLAGPNAGKRLLVTAAVLTGSFLALMVTPYADKVLGYIPFVGSVEKGTVDYRVRLVEVSMQIFWDSPILGNFDAMLDPRLEEMRQGQGIIDMVNTYMGVGLQYGGVGVLLFVMPFVIATVACIVQARAVEREHPVLGLTGRALAAVLVTTLVTIATTSSIEYMPIVYWPLVGCATAYLGIVMRWRTAQRAAAVRPYVARPNVPRPDAAQPNATRSGRPGATQPNVVRRGTARPANAPASAPPGSPATDTAVDADAAPAAPVAVPEGAATDRRAGRGGAVARPAKPTHRTYPDRTK